MLDANRGILPMHSNAFNPPDLKRAPLPDPEMGEPFLLTPGPLTTSFAVKQAMLRDWGSWDADFRAMTADLRRGLLALLGEGGKDFECVPMQGSGSYVVEAMLGSLVPRDGKLLVLANGAYGLRAAQTMKTIGRAFRLLDKGDYLPPRRDEVARILAEDPAITHVLAIHCETSFGHSQSSGRNLRGDLCGRPQVADRFHVRLRGCAARPRCHSLRGACVFCQQMYRRRARLWFPAGPALRADCCERQ